GFLELVDPAPVIGHRPAVERALERLGLVVRVVDQDLRGLPAHVDPGIVVPVLLWRDHAVADEHDLAVVEVDPLDFAIADADPVQANRVALAGNGQRLVVAGGNLDQRHVLEPAAVVARLQPGALELLDQVGERLLLARRPRRAPLELVERERAGDLLQRRLGQLPGSDLGIAGDRGASGRGEEGKEGAGESQHRGHLSDGNARLWHRLRRAATLPSPAEPCTGWRMTGDWQRAIERARAHAPFLAVALDRQPELAELLAQGDGEAALAFARTAGEGADELGVALRRERLALATALAIGDLAGAFPLARVMAELSDFADRALDAAIAEAIRRRVPEAEPGGFAAIALGKHGARELNYSSDIDPMLLFAPERLPRRERDEPGEAAQRYAQAVVEMLTRQTGEGYVFRVDLRLRPASEVSPLALSFNAAMSHYESSALAWERAAFIRSRAAAGDREAGEAFLGALRPFVWRRSLDFTAIEEIRR